ncbi:MAG TPA: 30S ribosomal protein S8 [Candidatus Poseidoniales archaeon]|jgi:small subunit ribosomal protein S8|nr:MAG: 30S ribosomal protein S8 [Euryarchaeota archaeon]HIG03091.1 30S ribosomal protein S8 [Candidatus Poseidoniales archaeon]HIK78463.1 30S ribosomal protein S8 [Candidatus Poseidoniales archaeon]
MQFDTLNDALVKIYNAEQAGKYEVVISPASKLLGSVLDIMQRSGYVGEYDTTDDGRGGSFRVELRGTINRCGVVKPRYSVKRQDYDKWESRYLPAQDFGVLILSTNQGVMNHYDAKDNRIGGRLVAYVY